MIDCIGRRKGRKELSWERQEGKKDRCEKTFHSLHITPLVRTRTTAVLECWHLPYKVVIKMLCLTRDRIQTTSDAL